MWSPGRVVSRPVRLQAVKIPARAQAHVGNRSILANEKAAAPSLSAAAVVLRVVARSIVPGDPRQRRPPRDGRLDAAEEPEVERAVPPELLELLELLEVDPEDRALGVDREPARAVGAKLRPGTAPPRDVDPLVVERLPMVRLGRIGEVLGTITGRLGRSALAEPVSILRRSVRGAGRSAVPDGAVRTAPLREAPEGEVTVGLMPWVGRTRVRWSPELLELVPRSGR